MLSLIFKFRNNFYQRIQTKTLKTKNLVKICSARFKCSSDLHLISHFEMVKIILSNLFKTMVKFENANFFFCKQKDSNFSHVQGRCNLFKFLHNCLKVSEHLVSCCVLLSVIRLEFFLYLSVDFIIFILLKIVINVTKIHLFFSFLISFYFQKNHILFNFFLEKIFKFVHFWPF